MGLSPTRNRPNLRYSLNRSLAGSIEILYYRVDIVKVLGVNNTLFIV